MKHKDKVQKPFPEKQEQERDSEEYGSGKWKQEGITRTNGELYLYTRTPLK